MISNVGNKEKFWSWMLDEMYAALAWQTIFNSKKSVTNFTGKTFIKGRDNAILTNNFHVWAPSKSLTGCSIALLSKIRFRGDVYDSCYTATKRPFQYFLHRRDVKSLYLFFRGLCFPHIFDIGVWEDTIVDPGCFISDSNFSIPDPGSKRFWIHDPDPHQII